VASLIALRQSSSALCSSHDRWSNSFILSSYRRSAFFWLSSAFHTRTHTYTQSSYSTPTYFGDLINLGMCWLLREDTDWWRNECSMKWRAPDQEVDQRGHGERLCKKIAKHEIWTGRMLWIVVDGTSWWRLDDDQDSGWVGECLFWLHRLTRVVPDKGP